ncbi:MAG: hypothetical protein ACYCSP_13755 [Acidobacteriaceae bacterium]
MSPLTNEQVIGRAKNAMLSFFEQRLSVPKIYLDADWEGKKVDVLAIDRAGVGDVSVALVVKTQGSSPLPKLLSSFDLDLLQKLHSLPAHFKYLVAISEDASTWGNPELRQVLPKILPQLHKLFADDGVGRIGLILIGLGDERPNFLASFPAERFRSNQHIYDLADAFASSHTADFEVRESSL